MSDNTQITPGSGAIIATDELTINAVAAQVQRIKVVAGKDGTYTGDVAGRNVDGDANASALYIDPRFKVVRLSVTPTVSTSPAYTAKDAIGALMTFSNAVRASGGTCRIESLQLEDKGQQMASLDLVLFDRSITAPTDNAIFAPSDAELVNCVGVIPVGYYADFSTNSVATVNNVGLSVSLNGTDLFGALVARGTPTYTSTTDIVVTLTISQD